jgi:hypothetical protein
MIQNNLFGAHLRGATTSGELTGSDFALTEEALREDTEDLLGLLEKFSVNLADTDDLEEHFNAFVDINELPETEAEFLETALIEATQNVFGKHATDARVKAFLKTLSKQPGITKTTPNKSGMTAAESGIRKFLASLTVDKHDDTYGNRGIDAANYKQFNRHGKNNYGHDNVEFNLQPNRPLVNPRFNVSVREAFAAVDSVGMGMNHQYKVVNVLTGEYVSRMINKDVAEEIAADLNNDFAVALQESRKQPSPNEIASLPIQEGLHRPIPRSYLSDFSRQQKLMSGGAVAETPAQAWKKNQQLIDSRKAAFDEDNTLNELDSIKGRSKVRRCDERVEVSRDQNKSFLDGINTRGMTK